MSPSLADRRMPATLHPLHHSIEAVKARGASVLPRNMTAVAMPPEDKAALLIAALDIFCDCINVGTTFQDSLLAVYLSGIEHGARLQAEKAQP